MKSIVQRTAACLALLASLGAGPGVLPAPVLAQQAPRLPGQPGSPISGWPPLVTFELWFVQLDPQPGLAERLRESLGSAGLPEGNWVLTPGAAPELGEVIEELLASARERWPMSGQVRGSEAAAGHVVGMLGSAVRVALSTTPVGARAAGTASSDDRPSPLPDLRQASFALEVIPRSVDRLGRVETTVRLEVLSGNTHRVAYSHTLWLDRGGAPLAFVLGRTVEEPSYALGISARVGVPPETGPGLVNLASLDPFERQLFSLLDAPATRLHYDPAGGIGFEAWVRPAWPLVPPELRLGFRLPFPWGGLLQADALWLPGERWVQGRVALHQRIVHELDLILAGSARLGLGEPLEPIAGVGLGEVTHPTPSLSLEARYLPLAYRLVDAATNRWERVPALWEAGIGWRRGPLDAEAAVWGQGQEISEVEASLGLKVWGEIEARLGYRYAPAMPSPHYVVIGFSYGSP